MATVAVCVAPVASVALVLIYRIAVLILVRSSKYDLYYRDRWTGLHIERGKPDRPVNTARPKGRLRAIDPQTQDAEPAARPG